MYLFCVLILLFGYRGKNCVFLVLVRKVKEEDVCRLDWGVVRGKVFFYFNNKELR